MNIWLVVGGVILIIIGAIVAYLGFKSTSSSKTIILIGGIILLIIGIILLIWGFLIKKKRTSS